MSTKTSIKRIALVAVSALGFGLLSVAPSNAAAAASAIVQTSAATLYTTAGTAVTADVYLEYAAVDAASTVTLTPSITSQPAGNTLTVGAAGSGKVGLTLGGTLGADVVTTATADKWTAATAAGVNTYAWSSGTIAARNDAANYVVGQISVTPTTPGKYVIAITPTGASTTNTAASITVWASGVTGTVGTAGLGTTSLSAAVGGEATVTYTTANGTATGTRFRVESSGVGAIVGAGGFLTDGTTAENPVPYNGTTGDFSAGAIVTTGTNTTPHQHTYTLRSTVAGTQTITVSSISATSGVASLVATMTITWGDAPAVSATYSLVHIAQGAALADATTNAAGASLSAALPSAQAATIRVTLRDQNNAAIVRGVSATISGPGLLGITGTNGTYDTASSGRTVALTTTAMAADDNIANITVWSDGTAGTATVTISSGTTTLSTKTVYFYGTVAKLTTTQNLSVARASSAGATLGSSAANPAGTSVTTTPAVTICAYDANDNVVPGLTISGVISDSTVLASTAIAQSDGTALGDGYAGPGCYNASVTSAPAGKSGASATITYRTQLSTGAFVSAAPVTFTLGGSASTGKATMAFDKSSYAPGEKATLTVSVNDSAGNPVFDQDYQVFSTAPVFSKSVQGTTPPATAFSLIKGRKTFTVYAPVLDGEFNAVGKFNDLLMTYPEVKASATVTGASSAAEAAADAAAEAIDAANAATDAANLAAEAADAATVAAEEARDAADAATAAVEELASQVATLMAALKAQITTLANTVAKIAKKVRA